MNYLDEIMKPYLEMMFKSGNPIPNFYGPEVMLSSILPQIRPTLEKKIIPFKKRYNKKPKTKNGEEEDVEGNEKKDIDDEIDQILDEHDGMEYPKGNVNNGDTKLDLEKNSTSQGSPHQKEGCDKQDIIIDEMGSTKSPKRDT